MQAIDPATANVKTKLRKNFIKFFPDLSGLNSPRQSLSANTNHVLNKTFCGPPVLIFWYPHGWSPAPPRGNVCLYRPSSQNLSVRPQIFGVQLTLLVHDRAADTRRPTCAGINRRYSLCYGQNPKKSSTISSAFRAFVRTTCHHPRWSPFSSGLHRRP